MTKIKKIVLAYSGGLDTSIVLKWLKKTYDCKVVTFTADLGQGEDLSGVEENAIRTGALRAYVEDLREEFARDYIFPMMRSGAVYEGRYLLGTSIARPLISKRMAEIAREEGAQAVAHGATGKGNDQIRFELGVTAVAPELINIAPWRDWEFRSRTDLIGFAQENGIPVPVTRAKPYSCDGNLLHLSFEGGELEDPWEEGGPYTYSMCATPENAPDTPEVIELGFEAGNPVSLNDEELSPATLIEKLNELGGKHAIGRIDIVENRFVGMKSRGVYETPGGTIIHIAHRDLECLTLDREVMHMRDQLIPRYAEIIYNGFWFSPERESLQAFIDKTQEKVTGTVRLKLYKGNAYVLGRKSPYSLYDAELATFEEDEIYNQADAAGFIKLQGLRIRKWGSR